MPTSPDGAVTAVVHNGYPGVLLRADLANPSHTDATFERMDADGAGYVVRSGDRVPAPGGTAVAYDFDAPLGTPVTYSVNGSQGVTVVLPIGDKEAWLKSARDPGLSRPVDVVDFEESYPADVVFDEIAGSAWPAVTDSGEKSLRGTVTLRARGRTSRDDLRQLMTSKGPLLLQTSESHGIPEDLWLVRTGQRWNRPGRMPGWDERVLELPFVQVARPTTVDYPLMVPGWSWADVAARFDTVGGVAAAYPSVWDLLVAGVA